ncbi:hypothetical protein ANN_25691, partial [Periplaneta americana]
LHQLRERIVEAVNINIHPSSNHPSIHPSIFESSIHPSTYQSPNLPSIFQPSSNHPSIHLRINHPFIYYPIKQPSIHVPTTHPSIFQSSIHPSISEPFINLPISQAFINPSIYQPSIYPSIYLQTNHLPVYQPINQLTIHPSIHLPTNQPTIHPSSINLRTNQPTIHASSNQSTNHHSSIYEPINQLSIHLRTNQPTINPSSNQSTNHHPSIYQPINQLFIHLPANQPTIILSSTNQSTNYPSIFQPINHTSIHPSTSDDKQTSPTSLNFATHFLQSISQRPVTGFSFSSPSDWDRCREQSAAPATVTGNYDDVVCVNVTEYGFHSSAALQGWQWMYLSRKDTGESDWVGTRTLKWQCVCKVGSAEFIGKREDGNDTIKELKWKTLENRRRKTRITSLNSAHLDQKAWLDITARLEKPTYYGRNDHDFKVKCRKQKTDEGPRQIQIERSLTPVSKRVGVVGRKREKSTASHNVLVSRIFAAAALWHINNQSRPSFRRIDRLPSNPRGGRLAASFPNSKNAIEGHQDCGSQVLWRGPPVARMEMFSVHSLAWRAVVQPVSDAATRGPPRARVRYLGVLAFSPRAQVSADHGLLSTLRSLHMSQSEKTITCMQHCHKYSLEVRTKT